MIKFRIDGIVWLTVLIGLSKEFNFDVKATKELTPDSSVGLKSLEFEISKEDGLLLLDYLEHRNFSYLKDSPIILTALKQFIGDLSFRLERVDD